MIDTAPKHEINTHYFALFGLVFSLIAFSLSVSTPWILPEISPAKPGTIEDLEDAAIDAAFRIKDKIVAKVKGDEIKAEEVKEVVEKESTAHWSDHWFFIVIGISLLGVISGVIAFVRHEHKRMTLMAITMGIFAIIATYAWIVFAVFIFLALVGMVLDQFDFISL